MYVLYVGGFNVREVRVSSVCVCVWEEGSMCEMICVSN